jgi:hypothetical protein
VPVPRRRRIPWIPIVAVLLAAVLVGVTAVGFDVAGVGTRFENLQERVSLFLDPPPDRPIDEEILSTPQPVEPTAAPTISLAPGQTPPPTPLPTPRPPREPVDVDILGDPAAAFIHQQDKDWCAVAGTQMVLAIHGRAPLTKGYQADLASRIGEWESRRDSRNGGWGPAAMQAALEAIGVPGYEVRAYVSRQDALTDGARAIQATGAPVILLTWRGAHTWIMTGFRADADPSVFDNAQIEGVYILDPWYPDVSSIWGASDEPGHLEDMAEMRRNYLPWERPEGDYPTRDGLFIAVVPTQALPR